MDIVVSGLALFLSLASVVGTLWKVFIALSYQRQQIDKIWLVLGNQERELMRIQSNAEVYDRRLDCVENFLSKTTNFEPR
jgi:hypothetical protein